MVDLKRGDNHMYNFGKKLSFWNCEYQDNTDLAVIIAGDICEGCVNVYDYLIYRDNLLRLTWARYCLLLHASRESVAFKTTRELKEYTDKLLVGRYGEDVMTNMRLRVFILQAIQLPFSQWGAGCLEVEHCTLDSIPDSIHELSELLKRHLDFDRYDSFTSLPLRLWKIEDT